MWYTSYEVSVRKKLLRYFLWIFLVLWVLISFVLGYFYLLSTGSETDLKGGTFVEGIFDEVSYLPYLKTDDQSVFYQKFLFRSCLNLYEKEEDGSYKQDLCKVYTEDNQHYILKIIDENAEWSDGYQVSIDDVFFTYDQVIRQNRWDLSSLNIWGDISVALEDGKVYVTFPTKSEANINFFFYPILPKHIVEYMDLTTYKNQFSVSPITNSCATLLHQVKDINSLVFDVNNCENTKFSYYQIKSYESFEDFDEYLRGISKKAIIDAFNSEKSVEGFTGQKVLTSNLFGVFFNTNSDKINVRLRRSIGGLINAKFFTGDYEQYFKKYDGEFVNYFVSSGETITDLMTRLSLDGEDSVDSNDLKDSGAKELPSSMSINGVDRKFVFFSQKLNEKKSLEVKFSNEFSDIKVYASSNNSTWSPKNYKAEDKKITYSLVDGENLKVGVNNFTISGVIKNKRYTIASIDVYVFNSLDVSQTSNNWKIEVLYYNDQASLFAVNQLTNVFREAGVLDNFIFQPVYSSEELEGKLKMGTYDMYLGEIDLGMKKDILSLFGTEDSLKNPSRYRNPILSSLINQYYKTNDYRVKEEINTLFSQDMPLVFLGNTYRMIQLQEKIKSLFSDDEIVDSYMWRYDIYSKYSIVRSIRLNSDRAYSLNNIKLFFQKLFFGEDKNIDMDSGFENIVENEFGIEAEDGYTE